MKNVKISIIDDNDLKELINNKRKEQEQAIEQAIELIRNNLSLHCELEIDLQNLEDTLRIAQQEFVTY